MNRVMEMLERLPHYQKSRFVQMVGETYSYAEKLCPPEAVQKSIVARVKKAQQERIAKNIV